MPTIVASLRLGARTVIEYGKAGGLPPNSSNRAMVRKLFKLGRFGQKTNAGYYAYEGRTSVPVPEVTQIAADLAADYAIARRSRISPEEIKERQLYPLINECLRILEEGIACRPGDIDVVWVAGYGFPNYRGSPMIIADGIGIAYIAERLGHYAAARGNSFGYCTPVPLLTRLAQEGCRIGDLASHMFLSPRALEKSHA